MPCLTASHCCRFEPTALAKGRPDFLCRWHRRTPKSRPSHPGRPPPTRSTEADRRTGIVLLLYSLCGASPVGRAGSTRRSKTLTQPVLQLAEPTTRPGLQHLASEPSRTPPSRPPEASHRLGPPRRRPRARATNATSQRSTEAPHAVGATPACPTEIFSGPRGLRYCRKPLVPNSSRRT
jgi:hypothetical protein